MIYDTPHPTAPVDQGDIIDACPIAFVDRFDSSQPDDVEWEFGASRIIVLTQTCDLANQKTRHVTVRVLHFLECGN